LHIILGLLGTIVTILVLLNRLADAGIDIRAFNPFLWHRRRKWRQLQNGNPLYRLDSPMDTAGVLVVGAAHADGAISLEEKKLIQSIFMSEFNLSAKDSAGLFTSSVFMIGESVDLHLKLKSILKPSKEKFTDSQIESTMKMISQVVSISGSSHPNVAEYMAEVERLLCPSTGGNEVWQS